MRTPLILASFFASVLVVLPAGAQTRTENLAACEDAQPKQAIIACSALILSGREKTATLFDVHFNRGLAYAEMQRHRRAIADYDAALKIRRKDAAVLQSRCWSRSVAGRLSRAIEDCNAALALAPDDPVTLEIRGFTWRKMREFEKSISDYNAALKLRPEHAGSLFGRGVTRYDMGGRNEAQTDFAAARSLQPDIAKRYAGFGVYRPINGYGSITRTGTPSSQAFTASTVSE